MKEKDILVIIPARNESQAIGGIIARIKNCLPEADILAIDDGSTDSTAEIVRSSGATVIPLVFNMGYGVALQTGYKYACGKGYEYIMQIDADGQHDPNWLKDILRELMSGETDVVIGSRYLKKGSYQPPFLRRLGMKFFAFLTSLIIGQKISDPTSGLRGFRRAVLKFLVSDYFPVDYPDADAIIMMHRYGLKIKEIPVIMRPGSGKSMHSGLRPLYYVFKMLLSMFVTLLRKRGG